MIGHRWALGLGLLALACGGATADHERLGDQYYRDGAFDEALAEYRTAHRNVPSAHLWAKAGAAALRAGALSDAVEAYLALGREDPTRQQEAARGLERVIRAGAREQSAVLPAALVALRQAAPDRPLSRTALRASAVENLGPQEAVSVMPAAVGMADAGRGVDRLVAAWGRALESTTACEAATRLYRTALRRAADARVRSEARAGLGTCALQLGLDALAASAPDRAEDWFMTALSADTTGPVGHRARIGLGEARLGQGDVLGAALWWQAVIASPGAPDSLTALAAEQLSRLADAGVPAELPAGPPPQAPRET